MSGFAINIENLMKKKHECFIHPIDSYPEASKMKYRCEVCGKITVDHDIETMKRLITSAPKRQGRGRK